MPGRRPCGSQACTSRPSREGCRRQGLDRSGPARPAPVSAENVPPDGRVVRVAGDAPAGRQRRALEGLGKLRRAAAQVLRESPAKARVPRGRLKLLRDPLVRHSALNAKARRNGGRRLVRGREGLEKIGELRGGRVYAGLVGGLQHHIVHVGDERLEDAADDVEVPARPGAVGLEQIPRTSACITRLSCELPSTTSGVLR